MAYSPDLIARLAEQSGIGGPVELLPQSGMVNEAWRLGDEHILRIVRADADPVCDDEAPREAAVVPLARSAGVKTPELLDVSLGNDDHRPYTIYRLCKGDLLGLIPAGPEGFEPLARELGAELAKLHSVVIPHAVEALLRSEGRGEAPEGLARAEIAGLISGSDAVEMGEWWTSLRHCAGSPDRRVLLHNDLHPWNVLTTGAPEHGLAAILDWGDASIGDPCRDFVVTPLPLLRSMIEGYQTAGGYVDDGFTARVLMHSIVPMLWELHHLDETSIERRWWRFPPGGWEEAKAHVANHFPELA